MGHRHPTAAVLSGKRDQTPAMALRAAPLVSDHHGCHSSTVGTCPWAVGVIGSLAQIPFASQMNVGLGSYPTSMLRLPMIALHMLSP